MAKGITILLVIVGHCEINKIIRGIIFSFHMPLFFILSSLTMRLSCNVDEFFSQIKKSFFHLIVPAFLIFLFRSIVDIILNRDNARSIVMSVPKQYFVEKISTFIAGSGVLVKMKNISIPALGIPWFLLVLFCAKLIFDYIHLKFPKKIFILSVCLCSVLGIYCSKIQWLPFSFDIALAIQIFFCLVFCLEKLN
ncbi:MAG: acyltransferase family protein [Lachnospiraceae bacterium]|nr:acyltransferase family protein [Lachnospiraceae bacterium]